MREVELEQPIFGANYIKGKVNAEIAGNTNIVKLIHDEHEKEQLFYSLCL